MIPRHPTIFLAAMLMLWPSIVNAGQKPFYAGADISMLPEIEKAGGVFKQDDKPADALKILHDGGVNLWRIRLFVNPTTDFRKSHGATQDLAYVRALAKRIKQVGGT